MTKKLQLPPLTALRSFEAFGRHLNLRDSADELCVTQSAVSRQIKQLEDFLGVKLIERTGRSSQLSEAGRQYLDTLSKSFNGIAQQTQLLFPSHKNSSDQQILKLGIGAAMAEYWLLPKMAEVKKQFPNLDLEIYINRNSGSDTPLSHVDIELLYAHQSFQLGVRETEWQKQKLLNICDFPVCSPSLIKAESPINDLSSMLQYPLIHETSPHWWPAWLKALGYQGESNNHGPMVDDETLPIKMALAGQGIAMGDYISCRQYLDKGDLIRPVKQSLQTEEWVYLLNRINPEPHINAFCLWLQEQFKER